VATPSPVLLTTLTTVALAAPTLASTLDPAGDAGQGAMVRRLAVLAPDDTFLWIRVRRLAPDLGRLVTRIASWTQASGPLAGIVPARNLLRVRSAIKLVGNIERTGPGSAIAALAGGDFAFGVRMSGGRGRPFVIARVGSDREATRIRKLARSMFGVVVETRGPFLFLAPHGETAREIRLGLASRGIVEPKPAGRRILAELPRAPIAGWFDLHDTGPGTRLRNATRLANGGAAFFAGGMAGAIGRCPAVMFVADLATERIHFEAVVAGVEAELSPAARKVLFLDRPALVPLPKVPGTVARLQLSRSIGDFFLERRRLVKPRAVRAIDRGLSNIENLFRGYRLETDLLPAVKPGLRGIVRLWNEGDKTDAPFRFPQGLLNIDYEGKSVQRAVQTAAQIVVLASNQGRKRRGQLVYRPESETVRGYHVAIGELARPQGDRPWPFAAGVRLMSTAGKDGFFYGTSPALLVEVLDGLAHTAPAIAGGSERVLDRIELSLATAAKGFAQNLDVLATRLMLGEGLLPSDSKRLLTQVGHILAASGEVVVETALRNGGLVASFDWRPAPGFFDARFATGGGDK